MLHYLFVATTLFHCAALAYVLSRPRALSERLVALLLVGLIIDNATLASSAIGIGALWYEWANVARYTAHAVFIPLLLIAALDISRRAQLRWTQPSWVWVAAIGLSITGVAYGLVSEVIGIKFEIAEMFGHSRLVSADTLPPFATIITNFLIIGIGATLWRQRSWAWLCLGAAAVFFVNAATATKPWGLIAGNLAELTFVLGWLVTLRRYPPLD